MLDFKSFETVEKTIAGIEIMHMIYKRQVDHVHSARVEVQFINVLMSQVV